MGKTIQEFESLKEQLTIHKKNLADLEIRKAKFGLDVPLYVLRQIEDEKSQINRLEREIQKIEPRQKTSSSTESSDKELSLVESIKKLVTIEKEIEERFSRKATFLDIDIAGSTKLKEGEKDIDIIYSFNEYHSYIKEKVLVCNGRVLSSVADEVMAIFDAPDDALKAGIEIFKGRDEFNKIKSRLKKNFQFRIGVNTGVALVNEAETYSRVLDITGHLQKEASPGQILISEETYTELKDKHPLYKYKYIEKDGVWTYVYKRGGNNE